MTTKLRFSHRNFFVLRAPFLPTKVWTDYRAAASDDLDTIWRQRALAARVLFEQSSINEAIYLASTGLHSRLQSFNWNADHDDGRKLLLSFERYLNRMCLRSTPFGLFSTIAYGHITPDEDPTPGANFAGNGHGLRKVRIDSGYLQALRDQIVDSCRDQIAYLSNRSIYQRGDMLKYIDWKPTTVGGRDYQLSVVDHHPVVDAVLATCTETPMSPQQLKEVVAVSFPTLSDDVLAQLIDDMVDAKLLLPSLAVDLLSADPALTLGSALQHIPAATTYGHTLLTLANVLKAQESTDCSALPIYQQVSQQMTELTGGNRTDQHVRVDCFRDAEFTLPQQYCSELVADIELLMTRFSERESTLSGFAQQFERRYGKSVVPLCELLEDEQLFNTGDNLYTYDMLRKFGLDEPGYEDDASTPSVLREFDKFLIGKMLQGQGQDMKVLHISRDDVLAWKRSGNAFPDSLFAIMTVLPSAGEGGQPRTWLQGMSNASVGNWTGRFAYGCGSLDQALRDNANQSQHQDEHTIHAEICYIPFGKLGNVMTRADIWDYRINLVESDSHGSDTEIPLSDILVSCANREVQLHSRKFGKRIIPHMTCAHNVEHFGNIRAYTFLRQLELHPKYIGHFGWSSFFTDYPYLPRIEFGNIILAPARWLVESKHFRLNYNLSEQENKRDFATYLHERGVPALVELKEFDNTLLLSWNDPIDLDQLYRIFKKRRRLVLREVVAQVTTADGKTELVRHEVLLPFWLSDKSVASDVAVAPAIAPQPSRDLPLTLMSEVLFAKVYLPAAEMDAFLLDVCSPLVRQLREAGWVDDWFFIRYADPEPHLRLRFFVAQELHLGSVMGKVAALLEQAQANKRLNHFCFVPYERELARYGGQQLLAFSEQLFAVDSDIALDLLRLCADGEQARLRVACWAGNALLEDLGYLLPERQRLVAQMAGNYRREFKLSSYQRDLLGKEFRLHAAELLAVADGTERTPAWIQACQDATSRLRERRRAIVTNGLPLVPGAVETNAIVYSHLHMLCIRLFPHHPRAYEVIVYDTLERILRAALGKKRVREALAK